jgi:DNA-binding transcriptional LysR family regulator
MAMTIKQLTYFLAVVDSGRFTQAAALCRVAQPTLSKQIRSLEHDLGETLFTRSHDNVTPTDAGEALLPRARRIVADAETARLEIAELAGLRRGRLRLGATPSLCVSVVADVLAFFHDRYPGIALQVAEGGSQDLVRDLMRGQLDLALVIDAPDHGSSSAPLRLQAERADRDERGARDLQLTPVLREELVAVTAAAGGPDLGDHIGVAELAAHPLVINRHGYDLREVTLAACAAAGVEPRIAVEAGEMDSLLRMVERGIGVAIVPSLVLAGHPRLRASRLDAAGWGHRTIAFAYRTDVDLTRAALAFREDLLAVLSRTARTGGLPPGVRYLHPSRL